MTRRLLPGAIAVLLFAAPAQAATKSLSVARSADRDCTAKVLSGKSGVASSRFTAPAEGTVTARLAGRGDWDLAAFDSKGTMIVGSKAFGANEIVEVNLRRGARITLQACRVSGRGKTAKLHTSFDAFDFETLRQSGPVQLVEVPVSGPLVLQMLERLGLDVTHDVHDGHARLMLYGDADREILSRTGLGFEVVRADVLAAERAFRARDARAARAGASPLPTGRTEYRTLEEVQQELKDMQSQFPDLVRGFNLPGKTFQGRDIQAVEIATDVASEDDTRPVLYLNGIHHAREWPATEVIMEFAWDLLKNHKSDPQLANILKNVRVIMQPYTNVDGFIVSRAALGQPEDVESDAGIVYGTATGVVILGGSLGYKRKNCNPYPLVDPSPVCEYKIGTDNNRNYPHTWGGRGSSTNPNDQSYRGKAPASEPETNAVQLQQLSMNAPVLISMHNIAAKVLRPPGTEAEGLAPDEPALKELGRQMADPTGYLNQFGHELYDVTGGTKDWAYSVTGAAGYTVETGPADGDFHGPYQEVVVDQYMGKGSKAGRGMREALINAANWTRNEKWTGRITGRAPAGRTLRLTKSITTLSDPVCTVADIVPLNNVDTPDACVAPGGVIETPEKLNIITKVPQNGRFEWWVNPSSRPYAKAPEAYKLTCEQDGKVLQETDVIVARGQVLKVDLPCGGTLPPDDGSGNGNGNGGGGGAGGNGAGGPGANGTPGGCRDTGAPTVTRSRKGVRATRRALKISGKAKDRGCVNGKAGQPVTGTITKVEVAVARLAGKKCAFLSKRAKAGKKRSCKKPVWQKAKGTNKWNLSMRGRLPRGTYVFFVRGFDKSGNVTPARRAVRFRIR